jgi:hypothetical protein
MPRLKSIHKSVRLVIKTSRVVGRGSSCIARSSGCLRTSTLGWGGSCYQDTQFCLLTVSPPSGKYHKYATCFVGSAGRTQHSRSHDLCSAPDEGSRASRCLWWRSEVSNLLLYYSVSYVFLLLCSCILVIPYVLCSVYSVFIITTGILRLLWLRFFRASFLVVGQMPGYISQRRGTVRSLPN